MSWPINHPGRTGRLRAPPAPHPAPHRARPPARRGSRPADPQTGRNPDPRQNPAYLPGIDPARAVDYTVDPALLTPAASRADADGDALQGLSRGLALGMPAGLPGFRDRMAGGHARRRVGAPARRARRGGARMRHEDPGHDRAYFRAESANSSTLR
ncbi:hypothetical protein ACU686_39720 [Yinghuangia aomiensis]